MDDEQIAWVTHVEETEGEEGQGTEKESRASGSDDDGSGKTTQLEGPPQKRKRSGRKTSAMWDHFTVVKGSNPERASCNYCKQDYACSTKTHGTKSMWNHLDRCKKYPHNISKQKSIHAFTKKSTTGESEDIASTNNPKLTQKEIRLEIASYFILDELPFKHVNGRGFQRIMKKAFPQFELHSRMTVQRDIYQLYLDSKKKLKNELHTYRVSLTTDCWTSIQNIGYLCLTAHWIDNNWKLQKRIISFVQVSSHKGDMVGKELIACLNEWGITKVFSITVDNAASNSVALEKVKEYLQEKRYGVVLNGEMFHMRCCAHILNLIVCDGLKELSDSIASIRNAVRYVRSSPARLKRFKEACKEANIESKALLCLDVMTRWNSTYMMLTAALKFKKAFNNLEADANYTKYFEEKINGEETKGPPQSSDWDQAEVFVTFLKTFYDLTLKFSGSLYVTSNLFFQDILDVHSLLQELAQGPHTLMGRMAASMQLKFDKYWGKIEKMNLLMFVATVLDPRFKMEILKTGFSFVYEPSTANKMIKSVEKVMRQLYDFYKEIMNPPAPKDIPTQVSNPTTSSSTLSMSYVTTPHIPTIRTTTWVRIRSQVDEQSQTSELDDYLNDRRERLSEEHFDILGWWKANATKYKVVSQIAKDVLAVQVSTVASESAFSTGGRILDSFRSSLSPKMVEALVCSKNWLMSDEEEPIALREYMDEVQALEESEEVAPGDGSCITEVEPV